MTGTALTPNVAALLYREMEGNPLFVVEGIRAGMIGENHDSSLSEDGEGPTSSSLAPSIQAILAARLRQLSPEARRLATLAATIGRAFSFEVLAVASGRAEEELVRDLDEMWHWRIIREDGAGGYDFSHDKLRAVAYKEMSTVQRRALHRRVAEALLTVTAEEVDPVSGAVAYHFDRAALPMRALPYYERAAESARQVHATGEAIRYLRRALTLLDGLPPGPARDRRECALLTRLGPVLEATRGWADPEVGRVHERARALWDEEAGTSLLVPILWGLRTFHITRAEFDATHERGEELLRLARDRDDPLLQAAAYLTLGMTFFHRGDLPGARRHLERALSAHQNEPGAQAPEDFSFGPDLRVFALGYLSHTLCLLGRPDLALARSRESRVRAEQLGHPFTQALALDYAALLHHFRREPDEARAAAGVAIALCEKHGFAYYCAWGHIVEGATRSEDGDGERGRQCLQGGIEALTATGARLRMPYYLGLQASACRAGGETGKGLAYLEDALRLGHATDEHWGDAELHRLRGEFLKDTAPADADACFRAAWAQARRSHSRLFALRAATSRCSLALQVDAAAEAYSQLAEAIAWFVDGDDTADLREARAVLDEVQ